MAAANAASAPVNDRCGHCRGIVRCSTCGRPPASPTNHGCEHMCEHCGNPLALHPMTFKTRTFGTLTCSGVDDTVADTPPHRKLKGPRTYQPKVCGCGDTFTPTGPRDLRCVPCKARF